MTLNLKLGTSKVDITPENPVPLAGFSDRKGNYESITHRLFLKIWFFEQENDHGKNGRALIVQADLIWWGSERISGIKRQLHDKWGLEEAAIILHASHTHSGPQTSTRFTRSLGKANSLYIDFLENKLFEGIDLAMQNLEAVSIEQGTGTCNIGIHRRKLINGKVLMAPNPEGLTDPDVNVIRFQTDQGSTKGVMLHYTCHPTTTGENAVSSEFPGIAVENVEKTLGNEIVVSFLQGCCGDIRPKLIRDGQFFRGRDLDVCRMGKKLSDEILRILRAPMNRLSPTLLRGRKQTIDLPFQYVPDRIELQRYKDKEDIFGEWGRLLLEEPHRLKPNLPFEMSLIDLAEGLSFLAMDGELVVDYGLFIKHISQGTVLPLPYSNGMVGYIPSAQQIEEGGYEGKDSIYYFGLPGPFQLHIETIINKGLMDLILHKNIEGVR
jgi:hypothetical protein